MIEIMKKIWRFAESEQQKIRSSIIVGFIYAIFHMLQVSAIYFVIIALVDGERGMGIAWLALGLLLVSIIGRATTNHFTQLAQTHADYFMVANRRIAIADKLKRVPMGYFSDKSIGTLTGVTTNVLGMVEMQGPMVFVGMMSGLVNTFVFIFFLICYDWRIGLIALGGAVLYLLVLSAMEKKTQAVSPARQASEMNMVDAVLEQLSGMSVIKSFNLTGKGDKRVRETLAESERANLAVEDVICPYIAAQEMMLHAFSVLMMAAAVAFHLQGSLGLADALMYVVISFMVFAQIQSTGSAVAGLRLVASSIDEAESIDNIPEMDDDGKALAPEGVDIVFDHVAFAYGKRPILQDVSLTIPTNTTTAIVGPSGSGKTTLCHLIARFWDVDAGSITIGGYDVRDYTLAALMDQMSMVFQDVYLFADTIENNIKFGVPDASHDEVVHASKAAQCHDFIMSLPEGYDTVIGEGGATLSGGEKQRISIARAMLKDAPIIILDEATASVDPENEAELQAAFKALTHEKTVIMIAHRLSTVRHADQILVLDHAAIVQRGTHDELICQDGLYRDFVNARETAVGWKLGNSRT